MYKLSTSLECNPIHINLFYFFLQFLFVLKKEMKDNLIESNTN